MRMRPRVKSVFMSLCLAALIPLDDHGAFVCIFHHVTCKYFFNSKIIAEEDVVGSA